MCSAEVVCVGGLGLLLGGGEGSGGWLGVLEAGLAGAGDGGGADEGAGWVVRGGEVGVVVGGGGSSRW